MCHIQHFEPLELGQEKNKNLKWPQFKWPVTPQKVQYDKLLFSQIDSTSKQMTVPKRIKKFPVA